ncbi:unnamed protein product [Nezara viridula]|uniref:Uncharacterized protein n=1 Tax=Nezara viridula TaxID=85310 RepID=A0A9P0H1E0_NEZVI|nr:unnamed protein product [Nezara viridula]
MDLTTKQPKKITSRHLTEEESNADVEQNKQKLIDVVSPLENEESVLSGWEEATHDVPQLPNINLERDFIIAKSYLQKIGCRNETIWDHLNDILNHVMKERPKDCMRYFEELSREIRIKKFFLSDDCEDTYKELSEEPRDAEDGKCLLRFYRKVECYYQTELRYEDKFGNLDFVPFFRLLNEAGVSFPYSDTYNIQMGMRLLAKTYPIVKFKLWGKILGTLRDYIIVEAELTTEAMGERFKQFMSVAVESMHAEEQRYEASENEHEEEYFRDYFSEEASLIEEEPKRKLDTYVSPPIPSPQIIKEVIVPVEPPGHGPNRKVYLVANDPSEEWIMLPDVTPLQIVSARQIQKYFTGVLTNPVSSYPQFQGTEMELLRAQIARITATTHVSPLGFYSAGGEEEAVEIEEGQLYMENIDYQPLPTKDLLDPTLEFWVHHEQFLLEQGRTEFWSAESVVEAEMEDEQESPVPPHEVGPPILTTLSQDIMILDSSPAWNVRRASTLLDEDSAVVLRSNIWPGALTAVKERLFVNFYVGWGTKGILKGFSSIICSKVEREYELGPEIMEMQDPTVEMEEFRWLQLHPKILPHKGGGEEMGAEEEESV